MMKRAWPWVLMFFIGSLPFLLLMVFGAVWLWQQQWFWFWLNASAASTVMVWIVARRFKRSKMRAQNEQAEKPDTPFSQRDQAAWDAVLALIPTIGPDIRKGLVDIETWLKLGQHVLREVAQHYRPKTQKPEMDIPVTELLRLVEQVCQDLHRQIKGHIPFSHVLTLSDGLNLQRWLDHLADASTALRLGRVVMNPMTGVLYELKNYAQEKAVALTVPRLQNWLLETYIQKVGHYAIMLYSGRLAVDAEKVDVMSSGSSEDSRQAAERQKTQLQEPLRILLAGQTNAGKSTLLNTLFESPRAAADVVSCTDAIMPYTLEREGGLSGLIFDTPGYGEQTSWLNDNREVLDKTDLVMLVCNANNAARAADQRFLQAFHEHYQIKTHRKMPPIIVVVTHIDELRPLREWQPPYDVTTPVDAKAANIRAAMDAIQQDLALPDTTAIVPVSLSNNEGLGPYNVDSLLLVMGQHMDEAHRARLLRCLKDAKNKEKWLRLWQQVGQASRWFLRKL